jgi:hypothetical protein
MTKFSARFDAKAAKDAKGKGKVNPPTAPSQGGAANTTGSNPGMGAMAASPACDSPQGGKNPVVQELKLAETFVNVRELASPKVKFAFSSFYAIFSFIAVCFNFMFLICRVQLDLQ